MPPTNEGRRLARGSSRGVEEGRPLVLPLSSPGASTQPNDCGKFVAATYLNDPLKKTTWMIPKHDPTATWMRTSLPINKTECFSFGLVYGGQNLSKATRRCHMKDSLI